MKIPSTKEDFKTIEKLAKPTEEEQAYIKSIESKIKNLNSENKIAFWENALEEAKEKYRNSGRVAVQRWFQYKLGHSLEWLATKEMNDESDLEKRAEIYTAAALSYNLADELIGYLSDFALRQGEAFAGAGHCYELLGKKEECAAFFGLRQEILNAMFSGMNVVMVEGKLPEVIKKIAHAKSEGNAVNMYALKLPLKNPLSN